MAASALDAAPVVEEPRVPGGGGPGNDGPDDWGGGGDGDHDGSGKREALYRIGVLLTIASIAALFISLVLVFWFRSRTAYLWQPVETPRALWASTLVLAISSVMLELARHALAARHWFAYRRRLLLTIYLGLAFIACQGGALFQLVGQGMLMRENPHASVFYVFTGAHGLHLAGGMIALNYLLFRRGRNWTQHRLLAGAISLYWHFMGVLWVALFLLLLMWQ